MGLAEGEMGAFADERDALGVAEGFGLSEDGVFSLAGEIFVFKEKDEFAFGRGVISVLVGERGLAEFVLLL